MTGSVARHCEPTHNWTLDSGLRDSRPLITRSSVLISSADFYGVPELDSEQIAYRTGHEVAASHFRGRVQALEIARCCWDQFYEEGMPVEAILVAILIPWSERIDQWSRSPIDPTTILTPPRPEDGLTEDHMRLLDFVRDRAEADPRPSQSLPMKTVRQLVNEFPELRRPVIHGLLREGETMNIVASPKVGKSWLVTDLAMAVATGGSVARLLSMRAGRSADHR